MGNCFGSPSNVILGDTTEIFDPVWDVTNNRLKQLAKEIEGENGDTGSLSKIKHFTLEELINATGGFNGHNKLGEGGFGVVYKGEIAKNTNKVQSEKLMVAIKIMNSNRNRGQEEWLTEVLCLSQLDHPNLIELLGCCLEKGYLMLIYEYLPMGSLEDHLFIPGGKRGVLLDWLTRLKIATGAAQGVAHLHSCGIIHRDLKSSNVLLNSDLNPKVSDFGLAKATPQAANGGTHVSTRVMGTNGYCDPLYMDSSHLRQMCDVYSFGVVLLEMLTGQRALEEDLDKREERDIVKWARPHIKKHKWRAIIDPTIVDEFPEKLAYRAFLIAYHCTRTDSHGTARPAMPVVVRGLECTLNLALVAPRPRHE